MNGGWSGALSSSKRMFQAIVLYLRDKVVEKPILENGLCNPGFGVTLPHNRKRVLDYVFRALGFSE